jgi:hypothetical protein
MRIAKAERGARKDMQTPNGELPKGKAQTRGYLISKCGKT